MFLCYTYIFSMFCIFLLFIFDIYYHILCFISEKFSFLSRILAERFCVPGTLRSNFLLHKKKTHISVCLSVMSYRLFSGYSTPSGYGCHSFSPRLCLNLACSSVSFGRSSFRYSISSSIPSRVTLLTSKIRSHPMFSIHCRTIGRLA